MNKKLPNKRFLHIDELYAFIVTEGAREGPGEGILGALMPNGEWMPFVFADVTMAERLKPWADKLAKEKNIKYEIRRFKENGTF